MKIRKSLWFAGAAAVVLLVVAAVVLHSPGLQRHMAGLHGNGIHPSGPSAVMIGDGGGDAALNARVRSEIAALGRRWDADAYERTISLYTELHRTVEWPGVPEHVTMSYGDDAQQTLEMYVPAEPFSEPGPVFVMLGADGLGQTQSVPANSEGLLHRHIGKLSVAAGGIGVLVNVRDVPASAADVPASRVVDIRAAIEWLVGNVPEYDGDPTTIVLLANAEAATAAAAYLFDAQMQSGGSHVAAAVLASGRFAEAQAQMSALIDAYEGEPVPLALWKGEFDPTDVAQGVDAFHQMLCVKFSQCPMLDELQGHNHLSHLLSLGTADNSVLNSFIRFYHTVR